MKICHLFQECQWLEIIIKQKDKKDKKMILWNYRIEDQGKIKNLIKQHKLLENNKKKKRENNILKNKFRHNKKLH
jgi:hypothetical protein